MSDVPTGKVWLRVNRVDEATCRAASMVTLADIYESMDPASARSALMSPRMRPLGIGMRMAGPAITAWCPGGDNLMMHRALSLARAGDVLVVVCAEELSAAQWGDVATTYAARLGLAGVVVHGCVRDVATLERLAFPVWSTAVSPRHPDKQGRGYVNAPVVCDGVTVDPGALVVGDGDGVLVVPRREAHDAVARAHVRSAGEDEAMRAIDEGDTPWRLSGASKSYAALEIDEYDAAYDDEQ